MLRATPRADEIPDCRFNRLYSGKVVSDAPFFLVPFTFTNLNPLMSEIAEFRRVLGDVGEAESV